MPPSSRSSGFNIVLIPPPDVSRRAIAASRGLKKRGGLFALDGRRLHPHVTVYMVELPIRNLPKVRKALRAVAARTKQFRVSSPGYFQSTAGYVWASHQKSKGLMVLQKKIVAAINPLREGLIRPHDLAGMHQAPAPLRRNLERYGAVGIGVSYNPHLTFTKLRNPKKSVLTKIKKSNFSFDAAQIGLFRLGKYGTCTTLIEKFDL